MERKKMERKRMMIMVMMERKEIVQPLQLVIEHLPAAAGAGEREGQTPKAQRLHEGCFDVEG